MANDLLQRLPLQDLIGFLLRTQFDQQRLVNALKCGHLGVLSRIGRMGCGFELADVGLTLRCICADRSNRLQIACIHGIGEINRCSLCCDRLLALRAQAGISRYLPCARKTGGLICGRRSISGRSGIHPRQ